MAAEVKWNGPIVDNHFHLNRNGLFLQAAGEFKRVGGTDFRPSGDRTCAQTTAHRLQHGRARLGGRTLGYAETASDTSALQWPLAGCGCLRFYSVR